MYVFRRGGGGEGSYMTKLKHKLICVICTQAILDVAIILQHMLKAYYTHP